MKNLIISSVAGVLIFIAGSVSAMGRGEVSPPPRFFGGDIGGWMGDGGSGPLFGFDDPWGKDMPFGAGGIGTPGFTGWLSDGDWTRGTRSGNPFGGGGNSGGGMVPDTSLGCPGVCQRPSVVGPCIPLCYCRPYYLGYPGDLTCDINRGSDWNGRMCFILRGGCPDK